MFGSKKNTEISSQVESIIGVNTAVKGTLSSSGALRIDGQFDGEVSLTADLIVGETGRVVAQISAKNALIAGSVTGNMDIESKLELLPSAKVIGDLQVGTLIIGEGAVFKGKCEMRQEA